MPGKLLDLLRGLFGKRRSFEKGMLCVKTLPADGSFVLVYTLRDIPSTRNHFDVLGLAELSAGKAKPKFGLSFCTNTAEKFRLATKSDILMFLLAWDPENQRTPESWLNHIKRQEKDLLAKELERIEKLVKSLPTPTTALALQTEV